MIKASAAGSFDGVEKWLKKFTNGDLTSMLSKYGEEGVRALRAATPKDSSETANSWSYEILREKGTTSIIWSNSHMAGNTPVAILLQYGHATGTGGYVEGRDYINPALQPIFDRIAAEVRKAVTG